MTQGIWTGSVLAAGAFCSVAGQLLGRQECSEKTSRIGTAVGGAFLASSALSAVSYKGASLAALCTASLPLLTLSFSVITSKDLSHCETVLSYVGQVACMVSLVAIPFLGGDIFLPLLSLSLLLFTTSLPYQLAASETEKMEEPVAEQAEEVVVEQSETVMEAAKSPQLELLSRKKLLLKGMEDRYEELRQWVQDEIDRLLDPSSSPQSSLKSPTHSGISEETSCVPILGQSPAVIHNPVLAEPVPVQRLNQQGRPLVSVPVEAMPSRFSGQERQSFSLPFQEPPCQQPVPVLEAAPVLRGPVPVAQRVNESIRYTAPPLGESRFAEVALRVGQAKGGGATGYPSLIENEKLLHPETDAGGKVLLPSREERLGRWKEVEKRYHLYSDFFVGKLSVVEGYFSARELVDLFEEEIRSYWRGTGKTQVFDDPSIVGVLQARYAGEIRMIQMIEEFIKALVNDKAFLKEVNEHVRRVLEKKKSEYKGGGLGQFSSSAQPRILQRVVTNRSLFT